MNFTTFFIHTTGCKANQWDSSVIAGNLVEAGLKPAPMAEAGLVVINACTVTEGAVRDIRRFINRVRRGNAAAKVVIAGCHGEVYPDDSFGADLVLGQTDKFIAQRYGGLGITGRPAGDAPGLEPGPRDLAMDGKTRFFYKIQDGCDRFCSYCIVPHARGAPRSRPLSEVLKTMEALADRGTQEVVLTGIEISAWRDPDTGAGLTDLIRRLDDVPSPPRIRLSSVDPLMLDDAFIETLARSARTAPSIHIPLQSGSDTILEVMRRPYRQVYIRNTLERLFRAMPDAGVGMDVIVGFPGEGDEQFQETCAFIQSSGVCYLHVFPFSPRPGTPAALMKGMVPQKTKKERVRILKSVDADLRDAFHRRFIGNKARIIPEGKRYLGRYMRGYTDNYIPVHIPHNPALENRIVEIVITGIENGRVIGKT